MTEPDRRAELVAAALADELSPAEAAELEALRSVDPTIDVELAELREIVGALPVPSADLGRRVREAVEAEQRPVAPLRPRRAWAVALGAAACLAVGAAGAVAWDAVASRPPTGAPGTLGAHEAIDFIGEPADVSIEASLVAHTWGTETFLEIDGLPVGDDYSVVLVDGEGRSVDSGSFIGSMATVDCRMNAALLREAVTSVLIEDESGAVVATAELPPVAT